MAKKKSEKFPFSYHTVTINGIEYFRTRIPDADGKRFDIYGKTVDELREKLIDARKAVRDAQFRRDNPTVEEYCEKWLKMQSAHVMKRTLDGYRTTIRKHIVKPLGHMYMADVTADDIKMAMVPVSKLASSTYNTVNMLVKSIFYSAEYSNLLDYNPSKNINPRGGVPSKERLPLTDEQVETLLDTIKDLPPYLFVMIGLYSGLRREEILALQWDCVFLDEAVPYISVRRAWRPDHNRPVISTELKTKAAKRDVPIPENLAECLREEKERSNSEYVISDSNGAPLAETQFTRLWNYIKVRSTMERKLYKYINGQKVVKIMKPKVGDRCVNRPDLIYRIDFHVSPHVLRHTYITNLIHTGVDPKTVQYLAGHENSKTTMDIYAKVKYNRPEELCEIVNEALKTTERKK